MARVIPIRRSLLGSFLLVVILLGGTILIITLIGSRQAIRTFSQSLMSQTIDQVEGKLSRFIDPAIRELHLARSWGSNGLLDISDPENLNRILMPLIKQHPQISSLMVADDRGREYLLLKIGEKWQNRIVRRDEWGARTRWLEWFGDAGKQTESWKEMSYDPRLRPWYQGAQERYKVKTDASTLEEMDETIHWTEPYTFFSSKTPGITASIAFRGPDQRMYVVGFDILLRDISDFTAQLKVKENGKVTVLTDDGRVIGLPAIERFKDPEERQRALLKSPLDLDITLASDAAVALAKQSDHNHIPLKFTSNKEVWWGQVRHFYLTSDRYLVIAVMVPERDMLDGLAQVRVGVVLTTGGVLMLAILLAFLLARRYSQPIEALVQQINGISRGSLEDNLQIESGVSEIKQLTDAHNRMRISLRSLLKLERDLQLARQIQQKTFPDKLPDLNGFSVAAWSEPAEETGGDTYDVIGSRYDDEVGAYVLSEGYADRVVMLLADATGHGIGPALTATEVRAMLRMAVRMGQPLSDIATHMNEQLCADLHAGRFITTWIGELDVAERSLISFSAGQAPLLFYDADAGEFQQLEADTPPFGVTVDIEVRINKKITLKPGDIFAVISDGVFEAVDQEGNQFGATGVINVLSTHREKSPQDMLEALRAAVSSYTQNAAAHDDRTVIIIKCTKSV